MRNPEQAIHRLFSHFDTDYLLYYSAKARQKFQKNNVRAFEYYEVINYIAHYIVGYFQPTFADYLQIPLFVHAQWIDDDRRSELADFIDGMRLIVEELKSTDERIGNIRVGDWSITVLLERTYAFPPGIAHLIEFQLIEVERNVREIIDIFINISEQLRAQLQYLHAEGGRLISNWKFVMDKNPLVLDKLAGLKDLMEEVHEVIQWKLAEISRAQLSKQSAEQDSK